MYKAIDKKLFAVFLPIHEIWPWVASFRILGRFLQSFYLGYEWSGQVTFGAGRPALFDNGRATLGPLCLQLVRLGGGGGGGGGSQCFSQISSLFYLPSLYRLKCSLKGPLNPNQHQWH